MNRLQTYTYYLLLFLAAMLAMLPLAELLHPLKWDAIDQAYPWKYFIGQCLQDGTLPLWNPYQLLGSPIHADPQSSAWYPVTWFFGYIFGYNIYILSVDFLLHIFLAGMGMFYLAKQLKFRDETAFVMGVSYMLSGFFIGNAQHFMWIISGTWIPFIIGAFLQLRNEPSLPSAIRLGLVSFMMMTGGYPAFIFLLLYLLTAIFILFIVEDVKKKDYREIARFLKSLAVSVVFTLLAGMVVLASVYHLPEAMTRGSGVTLKQALFGAFSPQSFISFILPFASIREPEFYNTDLSMTNAYFGVVTLVFFLAGLMMRRTKLVNIFLGWGLFCLAASVGSALPVREFLYNYVPFMNLFRFPALFRVFIILSLVIVAGFAFDEWRKDENILNRKLRISLLSIAFLITGFIIYALSKGNLDFNYFIHNQVLIAADKSRIVQHIVFQGIIQLVILVFVFLLFTRWKSRKNALAGILMLVSMDLMLATRLNGPYTVYSHIYKSKEIYEHAKKFPDGFPLPGAGSLIDNRDTKGLAFQTLWRNMNIFHKQVSYEGYNPLHLKGFEEMADNHTALFETILQNPLVYLSDKVSPVDSMAIDERNLDYDKRRVYVEEKMLNVEGLMLNVGDTAIIISFSPLEVQVESRTKDKALVNLLQNNYYGWKARIDGEPAEIITANLGFIALPVPAGEHEVVFEYDPVAVKVGFWVSLIAVFSGIVYYFAVRRLKPSVPFFLPTTKAVGSIFSSDD
jgi:hypothetical protein